MLKRGYKQLIEDALERIHTLSVDEAQTKLGDPGVVFIDIREAKELEREGAIPGAFNAPRGMLEFWVDPKISGQYNMWVRIIAREVASSGSCLTIVGHTSRTGSEQFNDRLSMQRALTMQRKIEAQAPESVGRLKSTGMGFRENIVGSGTDDLRDALDRRVEFKVRSCQT